MQFDARTKTLATYWSERARITWEQGRVSPLAQGYLRLYVGIAIAATSLTCINSPKHPSRLPCLPQCPKLQLNFLPFFNSGSIHHSLSQRLQSLPLLQHGTNHYFQPQFVVCLFATSKISLSHWQGVNSWHVFVSVRGFGFVGIAVYGRMREPNPWWCIVSYQAKIGRPKPWWRAESFSRSQILLDSDSERSVFALSPDRR